MRNVLGHYVFNGTSWLQEDEKSWGSFGSAREFTTWEEAAEHQERLTSGDVVTYVMEVS